MSLSLLQIRRDVIPSLQWQSRFTDKGWLDMSYRREARIHGDWRFVASSGYWEKPNLLLKMNRSFDDLPHSGRSSV